MQAFNLLINLQHVSAHQETILNGGEYVKDIKLVFNTWKQKFFVLLKIKIVLWNFLSSLLWKPSKFFFSLSKNIV